MASLKLEHIYKVYPNGHKAVSDFNMEIDDGEFIVFVGPSGCGKSTTLRMIAGLEDISSGELYIGENLVNDMQPKDRDIAMVFQNYALYPHMTVYENMAFGLTLRKVPRTEIHEKVMWAADVLGLKDYLDRKPKAMSGGQRQRVSLGRAILRNPKVMLLDEPLSNLDAKLRGQMRSMISKLHQQLKTTFIYVTHDQVEAMTLGTRVVVMKLGRVQQIDSPQNLYDHPVNKFVAGFIGTPQMNFFNVTLLEDDKGVDIRWKDCDQPALRISKQAVLKAEKKFLKGDKDIILGFRCEAVSAEEEELAKGDNIVNVTISHFEELGNETLIYGDLKEIEGLGGESTTSIIIKAPNKMGHVPGDVIKARVDVERIHLFDAESEMTIIPPVPDHNVLPVSIENGHMELFGKATKPESIPVDFVKNGSISLPLTAFRVGSGEVEAKVLAVEKHRKATIALVSSSGKDFYVFVDDSVKEGDKIKISIDYSKASFFDEEEKLIASPLVERDNLPASFVNFKTAFEVTQDNKFMDIRNQRVAEVSKKHAEEDAAFEQEKAQALSEASAKQEQMKATATEKKQEIEQKNLKAKEELRLLRQKYRSDVKEVRAKHKEIKKEAIAKIEEQYKEMWEKEKNDFKQSMMTDHDKDSRAQRRMSWATFKESFPQMKANDLERKTNALEFDQETEENAIKAKFTQERSVLRDSIKDNDRKYEEEYLPLKLATKEYEAKAKALKEKHANELLHAELIFFFKFDTKYFLIPDGITNRIIQGLGNKVFTKVFRVEVPHDGYQESEDGIPFKVVSFVNYGDVQLYKCTTELYGEKLVVYINKEREIELGSTIKLTPVLEKSEIYENELNIRLY